MEKEARKDHLLQAAAAERKREKGSSITIMNHISRRIIYSEFCANQTSIGLRAGRKDKRLIVYFLIVVRVSYRRSKHPLPILMSQPAGDE